MLHAEFPNSHLDGLKRVPATKNILYNPLTLKKRDPNTKISKTVQPSSQFVILVSAGRHGGFNVNYNVAEATNFAYFLGPMLEN